MPWTDPPDFEPDTELTAADLDILGDDLLFLKGITDGVTFSGVKLVRSTNLSLSDSTLTDITYVSETFDFGGWWSSGATVTVPAGAIPDGYLSIAVMVIATLRYVANGTGSRQLHILKNGADEDAISFSALTGDTTTVLFTSFFTVEAADEIKVQGFQSSGGNLNVDGARLTVVRYAPAETL